VDAILPEWLAHRAATLPGAIAVADEARALTYAELDGWASDVAAVLRAAGVEPGDRVALRCPNSLEFAAAIHGITRAGAIVVPLNLRLTDEEQAWQLEHAGARVTLSLGPSPHGGEGSVGRVDRGDWPRRELAIPSQQPISPRRGNGDGPGVGGHRTDAVHAIIYTSGTTGRAKGAMLTYGNFWASAAASAFNIGVLPGDRWLACMPLFHVGGLSILVRSAIYGTAAVVHRGFDPVRVNRALREEGITLLSVVPTMLRRMLDADGETFPPTVRAVLVGGGPVERGLLEEALARGLPVLQTYGLTEACSQVTTLSPADARAHAGSAGKPLVSTRLRVDAPPGEPGEILVSGPTVTPGYWRDPEATARAIREGWLHTGDVGRLDGDGFLYVLDRRDDLVVSGGENVYPAEVEGHLLQHPGVENAAVVGLPDAEWGQAVAAAIVPREGFDADAVEAWLRQRLAGYKVPRRWVVVDALPVTASGKVQRHLVREMMAPTRPDAASRRPAVAARASERVVPGA
jgi:O-succinylbenzoic acid--CoA ligase